MFGTNKPAFGGTTSGFGSFNTGGTTASPFGGFKPAGTGSAFGAPPSFGSTPAQPASGGLFGTANTSAGLFGTSTSTATPAFGQPSTGFGGFGTTTSSGGGLFSSNTGSTGLFGNTQNTSTFGAKPAGFGFGSTANTSTTGGGLFGSTPAAGTGLFGQQGTTLGTTGGGLFNTSGGFGQQQQASGTAHVKYNPVVGTDVIVKSGTSQSVNIKHHCITCMKEYENKSLEELRLEDYTAGRKGASSSGLFGFQQAENKAPLFGGTTAFGQTPTTTAPSVFGGGTLGGASTGFGQTSTFSFGNNTANNANTSGGLFGAAKPAFGATPTTGTGLFGATTTQAPTFGTTTPSFGFGSNTQNQQQTGGLFGQKPATTGFGTTPASTGFGGFGANTSGGLFGKPAQTTAPTFGTTTQPAFGGLGTGGFGTNTSTSGGSLFGGNTFGKPNTAAPAFGFSAPNTQLGGGLGGGLGTNTFQAKPAAPAFGTLGGGSLFQNPQGSAFNTGKDSGLGGSMFGNTSLGGGMGLGLGTNQNANANLSGSSAAGNVHEQILTLVARPYGDSPLFKDLPTDAPPSSDVLKPTNPACVKAAMDSGNSDKYRVTHTAQRIKLQPHSNTDKKSLFDGLEESDASLEEKLTLKPSRKRLVLRPRGSDSVDGPDRNARDRSLEEQQHNNSVNGLEPGKRMEEETHKSNGEGGRFTHSASEERRFSRGTPDQHSSMTESIADRHGSWLNASKHSWSAEKEKPIDNEPTPRLYPNLDKELPIQTSERRASWLSTKPLRKPMAGSPEAAESSVRELGVRPDRRHDKENIDTLSGSPEAAESSVRELSVRTDRRHDKENIDTLSGPDPKIDKSCSCHLGRTMCVECERIAHKMATVLVSEEEMVAPRPMPPHPTGVKLTRPGYYTIPSLDEMIKYMRPDGSCVVPNLTIGRTNYGNVYYDCEIDVAGLDLDAIVHFMNKEVTIYPDDENKPPVGQGLNRRAIVTLDRIWPRDKTERTPITDPQRLLAMGFEDKLRRVCDKHDTKFVEYRPQTGSWVFRVEHFSKYSLTDSDEEDEITPEILKRQLVVNQALQKAAPLAPPKPPVQPQAPGLGGLGGLGGLSGPVYPQGSPRGALGALPAPDMAPTAAAPTHSGLTFDGSKAFEMDTTEDNGESSLYADSYRMYGVKSPTSELARLEHRHTQHVQLMKASLLGAEMEDDVSVSTGDQMVPHGVGSLLSMPPRPPSEPPIQPPYSIEGGTEHLTAVEDTEVHMRPLIVRPHTIVLKYHRKVPPFKKTIAGRLNAACIADMAVCRARHSRVGFGPDNTLAYPTTYDAVTDLPKSAELYDLGKYVEGRSTDDWSEPVVVRLALGHTDSKQHFLETMKHHLDILLEFSEFSAVPQGSTDYCPQLSLKPSPSERRQALRRLAQYYIHTSAHPQFGVSSSYCKEVFELCEALWGADLENDGVAGTDEASIVRRHRELLSWLSAAVAPTTNAQLQKPTAPEPEDETDTHSVRIWTLLLGGRVVEACKVAVEHGDCHMAAILAQCAGDPVFRSLVARQLSQWRECGADTLIAGHRLAALHLAAGLPPRTHLAQAHWLQALHATARYLCPQVPSLEQVTQKYESLFQQTNKETNEPSEPLDLSMLEQDEMGMRLPLPPYMDQFDVTVINNGKPRRQVLDLRYELIRARALNARPRLQPAAYTPDPMDYSLCFVLGVWFGVHSAQTVDGCVEQLEACGAWHLAVQASAYHPAHTHRSHIIRTLLSRHVPTDTEAPETKEKLDLMKRLRIPETWILLARAHRAKYERLHMVEAVSLAGAQQWNAAHRVLLDELLPEAVLSDDLQSIAPLLEQLNEAAGRHEVSGWEGGGQALHHYIHVTQEIRGLVSSAERGTDRSEVSARLEALRPRVAAACRALGRLSVQTARQRAARTEMGARLVQLALAAGEPADHLAALLKALSLPPDATASAHQKITTELAERASEMCIESTHTSPMSSHH